jgi:excisionase family DNA binding protein
MENLLTIRELSKILKINKSTLYQWVNEGKIPYIRMGGIIRFRKNDIVKWLDQCTRKKTLT